MSSRSPLDDRATAAHAWARYKRLMRRMALFTLAVMVAALGFVYSQKGMVSIHFYIATALGIGVMVLLTCALMGLVFLSSGTGHDHAVTDHSDDQAGGGRNR